MSEQTGAVAPSGLTPGRPLRVVVRGAEPWRLGERFADASRRLGVRPAGWVLLAAVVALAVAGGVLGWYELRVAAVAGAVVALCAAAFMIGRPHFDVHLQLPGRRVSVGDDASATVWVRNSTERATRGARMEVPVGGERAALHVPRLDPEAFHRTDLGIPTDRRAVVPVGPARSVQGDPFGLTGRESDWTEVVEVFVHPRTITLPGRQAGFVHDLEGHPTEQLSNSDMSFHALREYAPGDDRRHVHWRSTARTGKLMVRQFEETRQSRMAIGLDLAASSYADDDEFELAVSVVASLALQAVREGNPLSVIAGEHAIAGGTGLRLLDELCRVQSSRRALLADVVGAITAQAAGASIIALVTGSTPSQVDIRRSCAQFGVDARIFGIRVAAGEAPSARSNANVSILQVGALDELPRTFRRVM